MPVLLEVLLQAGEGTFSLDDPLEPMTQRTFGSGVLKELSTTVRMTVRDVGMLMIVISDNTSTNALIDLVGGIRRRQRADERAGLPEHHPSLEHPASRAGSLQASSSRRSERRRSKHRQTWRD